MAIQIDPQELAPQPITPPEVAAEKDVRVATEAAESFISEKRLGDRIKQLRLKKSMGLVELGRHTGLSASFLSQLETGRVVPTLRNLARIALVFSKDLSYFFEPEPKTLFRVQRGKDRIRLPQSGTDDPAYYFESLGYLIPDRQLDPYFAEFLPNMTPRRAHQHPGCEFLYVLEGELDITHGEGKHRLGAGDAVYFDANTPHSYANASNEPAKALIVTLQGNAASANSGSGALPTGNGKTRGLNNGSSSVMRPRTTEGTTQTPQ
ncbi:helix-turn-helix domain-containing protein [Terriglobus roseus]|uniref:Helix-turn-helix domain-containing protein n=1 Tax=Terriglobus roseus TaxID=392734 RepID=A0A1H4P5M2_9BACT|nr:cupin domain-containing protein [Terriglobus roseus]SEC02771.1 Helix-turn-helix domain-containing protein [Terriglobus roseus]